MKLGFILSAFVAVKMLQELSQTNVITRLQNKSKFSDLFRQAETANGLPIGLLENMAEVESGFRDEVIYGQLKSPAGAIGIMQIMPNWHPNVNPYDPVQSIAYAGKYVKSLYDQLGSWEKALAAYNWGIGNVQKYGLASMPTETRNYVSRIMQNTFA